MQSAKKRLLLWYAAFRLMIAIALVPSFLQNTSTVHIWDSAANIVLCSYLITALIQFVFLSLHNKKKDIQILLLSSMDVIFMAFVILFFGINQVHITLLLVVNIFIINLVHEKQKALYFTLISILSVIYIPLLGAMFDSLALTFNIVIITILYIVVSLFANVLTNMLKNLEAINETAVDEIHVLKDVSAALLQEIKSGFILFDEKNKMMMKNAAAEMVIKNMQLGVDKHNSLIEILQNASNELNGKFGCIQSNGIEYIVTSNSILLSGKSFNYYFIEPIDQIKQKIQQANLLQLGHLAASIAHEIRNPLASIAQANELLGRTDQEQLPMLKGVIGMQCERINNIITSTLDLAKSKSANSVEIDFEGFNALELADLISRLKNNVKISINTKKKLVFDNMHLSQVVANLLQNADRYNDASFGDIEIELLDYNEMQLALEVRNYGNKISEADQVKLFDPFFTTSNKGNGLGLYMSKMLCDLNKSQISYEYINDKSVFRIVFGVSP